MTVTIHHGSRHSAVADPETRRPEDWRARAACTGDGIDPELFFSEESTTHGLMQVLEAKEVCRGCPVVEECRRWNIEIGNQWGVWAGTSEQDRRAAGRCRAAEVARRKAHGEAARTLALQHGREVMLAHLTGQTEEDIAVVFGVEPVEARRALRILCPPGAPGVGASPLERALVHAETIGVLVRGERSNAEIGKILRFASTTIAEARVVLAHRQAAYGRAGARDDRPVAGSNRIGAAA